MLPVTPELITSKNLLGEDIRRYVIGIGTAGETPMPKNSAFSRPWAKACGRPTASWS